MITVTTDSVHPHERVGYWQDLVTRHVTPMQIEPSRETPLRGQVQAQVIGNVTVAEVSGYGIIASHTRAEVAHTTGHLYAVCVNLDGDARIKRRSERTTLQNGDVFITDSRDEFTLDLERPWRHLVLSLPTEWLDSRVTRPELLAGIVVRHHPLMRLWKTNLADGFAMASSFSPPAAALFARHCVELIAQALDEVHCAQPTPSHASRAAIFLHACHLIALRFGESNLGPDQIARGLQISTRSLARIFAAHNETVMRRVFAERVRQAMQLLTAPEAAHRSITEIAFACGFNDSSHFGRVFTAQVQVTPSQWRQHTGEPRLGKNPTSA
ncbi:MAG TPA: helix-turn-helix domain-containing protein [Gemmatimonadaceae bacterium]|jgi:AraC-like DNA-binding protein|nr:helix-turn-helix domain-containing protein [Gemmatimonadaceae bacterium]